MNSYFSDVSKPSIRILSIVLLSGSSLMMSACQKEPDTEKTDTVEASSTPVATSIDNNSNDAEVTGANQTNSDSALDTDREIDLDALENNTDRANTPSATEAIALNPEEAIKGTQITDVKYRSAAGETMSVVFETSATGVLNAIVTLPNEPKMTLSAPEGQGNNPTYRSKDGSTELVSHGGGSAIDLMQKGKLTSFDATSAEAEVITQP